MIRLMGKKIGNTGPREGVQGSASPWEGQKLKLATFPLRSHSDVG